MPETKPPNEFPPPVNRRRPLALAGLLLVLSVVFIWSQLGKTGGPVSSTIVPTPRPERPAFRSEFTTEQEWLVSLIIRHLAEIALFVETRRPLEEGQLRVQTTVGALEAPNRRPVQVEVTLTVDPDAPPRTASVTVGDDGHLWSPQEYTAIVDAFWASATPVAEPPPTNGTEDVRLLTALLDPRASTLTTEDDRLAGELTDRPLDPALHERAALLAGALAFRERGTWFADPRPMLCRMTAHLSLAHVVRGARSRGLSGRTAEAILSTLVGREMETRERIEELEGHTSPATRSWGRALRLRSTMDWRILDESRDPTLLEKLEEFHARAAALSTGNALRRLDERGVDDVSDWGHLATGFLTPESGQRFLGWGLALQLLEASSVWRSLHGADATPEALIDALNQPAGGLLATTDAGEVELRPLGWSAWGPFEHRRIVQLITFEGSLYRDVLGLPGRTQAYAESARQHFGRLSLFPLAELDWAGDEDTYRVAMGGVRGLAERTPERLTAQVWGLLTWKPPFVEKAPLLPDPDLWYDPPLPSGTLYAFSTRFSRLPALNLAPREVLAELRREAPSEYTLADAVIRPGSDHSKSVDDLVREFGELAEYNIWALGAIAQRAWYQAELFERYQGRLCDLEASRCYTLGHRLAELARTDEAARAYQRGFDEDASRVGASQRCSWLVNYYRERGRTREALAVAREAADTYSAAGLAVYAELLEQLGRLEEAEDYYLRLRERYEGTAAHIGYYYRRARIAGDAAYEGRFEDSLREVLPEGLEKLDREALLSAPEDGVVFRSANDNTKKYDLKWGDVVVGLDGFRIRDWDEYRVVRGFDLSPRMTLTVWQGQGYRDVSVDLHDRQFRVDMETYEPAGS